MRTDIKILTPGDLKDFIELIKVFEDVFEMKNFTIPRTEHLQKTLDNSNFFALVAQHEGKVIGGLTVYILEQYYSQKPLAYIYDLAILIPFQRKGVGKQLISYLTDYCREKGFEEVFVQANKVDDYALDFYRSTKITNEEEVVHFYYSVEGKSSPKN